MTKRLRIFAGPNGSGKSTIEHLVSSNYKIGKLVNADIIERELRENGQLNFTKTFGIKVSPLEFKNFLAEESGFSKKENLLSLFTHLTFRSNFLLLKSTDTAYSYLGAILSEFIRTKLLDVGKTFSFETVMSHESKLDFILEARKKGFKTYLYFVSTESADINVARVKSRVEQGGHTVPEDKIRSRYIRSLDLLVKAVKLSDRAFIFDNSGFSTPLLAEKNEGNLKILKSEVPDWFNKYLIERLKGG